MKCDELKRHHINEVMDMHNLTRGEMGYSVVYYADDVDAAIAELKKKLMPCLNGDCILTCEVVEKYGKENAELKAKLEDAKATAYAEMVDAGMRERRLRRALWMDRADRAIMTLEYFTIKCKWFQDYMKVEPPKCDVKMIHKWANIERKCRAKAEGYK